MGERELAYESMTALVTRSFEWKGRRFKAVLRSVNHRHLKLMIRQPGSPELGEALRQYLKKSLRRGSVELVIEEESDATSSELIEEGFVQWRKHCLASGLPEPHWKDYFEKCRFESSRDMSVGEDEEELKLENIESELNQLLIDYIQVQRQEGANLVQYLQDYLRKIDECRVEVNQLLPKDREHKLIRLKEKIADLSSSLEAQSRENLAQESAILLERLDASEECDRLEAHLQTFNKTLKEDIRDGKFLDFLCQELQRETNTLSNKAQSDKISLICVEMKTLIEKIREQVQNLV